MPEAKRIELQDAVKREAERLGLQDESRGVNRANPTRNGNAAPPVQQTSVNEGRNAESSIPHFVNERNPTLPFPWPSSSQTRIPSSEDLDVRQHTRGEPESVIIDLTLSDDEGNAHSDSEADDHARGLRSTNLVFGEAILYKEVRVICNHEENVTQLCQQPFKDPSKHELFIINDKNVFQFGRDSPIEKMLGKSYAELYNPIHSTFVKAFPTDEVFVSQGIPLIYRKSGLRDWECVGLEERLYDLHKRIYMRWPESQRPKDVENRPQDATGKKRAHDGE